MTYSDVFGQRPPADPACLYPRLRYAFLGLSYHTSVTKGVTVLYFCINNAKKVKEMQIALFKLALLLFCAAFGIIAPLKIVALWLNYVLWKTILTINCKSTPIPWNMSRIRSITGEIIINIHLRGRCRTPATSLLYIFACGWIPKRIINHRIWSYWKVECRTNIVCG